MNHPTQPLYEDSDSGTLRFKKNAIVRHLLDNGKFNLDKLAALPFSDEDRQQFAQLIGYSLDGYSCLAYVPNGAYEKIIKQHNKKEKKEKKKTPQLSPKKYNVRCFKRNDKPTGRPGIWIMTSQEHGVFFHGDRDEVQLSRYVLDQLLDPNEFGFDIQEITVDEVFTLLTNWAAGIDQAQEILNRHKII